MTDSPDIPPAYELIQDNDGRRYPLLLVYFNPASLGYQVELTLDAKGMDRLISRCQLTRDGALEIAKRYGNEIDAKVYECVSRTGDAQRVERWRFDRAMIALREIERMADAMGQSPNAGRIARRASIELEGYLSMLQKEPRPS